MEVIATAIPDVCLVRPKRHGDPRGWFSEVWNRQRFAEAGLDFDWMQDNQSLSGPAGTLRGLHFQTPPFAQTKLVRVLAGAILDVAVDLRRGSPWFGRHVAVELSAGQPDQILIPRGFAHGFVTLKPNTQVLYKVDAPYAPDHDAGIAWNDPDLAIAWPVGPENVHLSDKDRRQPAWRELPDAFSWSE
ncbi:dTDP-4-dehydrorhamnose 3,5-epimerase [Marinivivus vitaminiproducens]|uniref:dTDP-4-dehydrorhamnose 3,5-epimerase n=1 Tax=Marinivivus vitaminiproducens TaxID=3035935 RepID=UPI00279E37E7|nr:dTDP-4-dehydrorhamnose 3,5-epimerase [Geminicoccaceae bacterium SCSIO 64248]